MLDITTPDFVCKSIMYNYLEKIDESNNDFLNWLNKINDMTIFTEAETNGELDWFIKWKNDKTTQFKNNINILDSYTKNNISQDINWIKQNNEILTNNTKYPVKQDFKITQCPDYIKAMQRINDNLGNSVNSIDITKVIIDDKQDNLWLKQTLIKDYRPTNIKENFSAASKNYYMGADHMTNMNYQQIQNNLQAMTQFCIGFNSLSTQMKTQANLILNFINKDPSTGLSTNNTNAATNAVNNKPNGMASTNPNANVNASYTFEDMIGEYGLLIEEITPNSLNAQQIQTSNPVPTTNNSNTSGNLKISTPKKNSINDNQLQPPQNNIEQEPQKQDGTQETRLTISRKQQIAGNILIDAMNGKMTASIKIFKQIINILKTHVESYNGSQVPKQQTINKGGK